MELLNKYQELINAKTRARNGTRIKRINVISNEQTIFNSWNELKIKSGHSQKKIKDVIKNKIVHGGAMWEYV
jgi:hypothetical protein